MQKIDFVNAQEPAINDTNLNLMQTYIETAINAQVSGDTLPVGCIVPFTSDTVPENWLLCDGQAVSRTEYDLLFSIIGTTYGVGDGSTTFNLPNLKGRVAVGKDSTQTEFDNLGETGGEKTHTLTVSEMPSHSHNISSNSIGASSTARVGSGNYAYVGNPTGTIVISETGGGQAHNILQPYQVTNYIIKAKQSAGIVATVVDSLDSTSTTNALSANQGRLIGKCSTNNEIVVGHWIDNKPIYRKVFEVGLIGETSRDVKFSFDDGIYKRIIRVDAHLYKANGQSISEQRRSDDAYLFFNAETTEQANLNLVVLRSSSTYWSDWYGCFVVEYTKTTD